MVFLNFKKKKIFSKKYKIGLASYRDKPKIQKFIDEYWKKNHILSKNSNLFNFQHGKGEKINWILAKNNKTKNIVGILGLISKNYFDKGYISKNDDIWIAIIMVAHKFLPPKGLGTEMIRYFTNYYKPNSIAALGINLKVSKLYKKLGLNIKYLNHYYYQLDKSKKLSNNLDYKIINEKNLNNLVKFKFFDQRLKNLNYFKNRYLFHPTYKYYFISFNKNETIHNFIILRKIKRNNITRLRIIDVASIKNLKILSKKLLNNLTLINKADYIDFLNYGINNNLLERMGFKLKEKNKIIPNHFEPFINKNVNILIAYKSSLNKFRVFKGDSDLDRPSTRISKKNLFFLK